MSVIIPIRAVTKGRPRLGRRRKAYTPAKTLQFEADFAEKYREATDNQPPLEGPVGISIIIGSDHVEVDTWELDQHYRPKYITGDVDNYVKSISDALNGVAYVDDKQIHHLQVWLSKEGYDNE